MTSNGHHANGINGTAVNGKAQKVEWVLDYRIEQKVKLSVTREISYTQLGQRYECYTASI